MRQRTLQLREDAISLRDDRARRILLDVAKSYDTLAEEAEHGLERAQKLRLAWTG